MRLRIALLAAVGATAAVASATAAENVTLTVKRVFDPACRCLKVKFSGRIASGAANEYVAVVHQRCGDTGGTAVAGASTTDGGYWQAETYATAPGLFRAQWKGKVSAAVPYRPAIWVNVERLGGDRYRVVVDTHDTPQDMSGKVVELQRLATTWTRVRRITLARSTSATGAIRFTATFAVRTPKLLLRVLVPARTAWPCFAPGVSKTWTS